MPVSIEQAKSNCIKARAAMQRARQGHFALGAFNLDNQETLLAVARAAATLKAPVIVELSKTEVDLIGFDNVRAMVDNYRAQYQIEMYLNLDHSPNFEDCEKAIRAGFEMVHIDISQADHNATREEIITKTKKVVEAAKLTGAIVEAEERYFMGSSNLHTENIDYQEVKKFMSTAEGAADFVAKTGIDTFAAQIGNLHGSYPVPKVLDLELLKHIRQAIECNISLHGGSDTPGHYFIEATKIGVTKININTDMRVAYRKTLEAELKANPSEYAVIKLMDKVIDVVQKVVESKITDFNSSGQARF